MRLAAVAGLALLAACSSKDDVSEAPGIGNVLTDRLKAVLSGEKPTDIRAALTPENIAAFTMPLLLAEREREDLAATFVPVGVTGPITVWQTPAGGQLTIKNGVVITTRGYGFDIHSSDVDATFDRIAAGDGTAVRVQYFMTGEGKMTLRSMACRYTSGPGGEVAMYGRVERKTRIVKELCRTSTDEFANVYLFDGKGDLWQSRQWFGPKVGMVRLTYLKR